MATGAITNYSVLGASKAVVSGLQSTNFQQGVIPSATVTVYLTGTTTKATIYADPSNTPLSNPFTSGTTGQWLFYAATGQAYDVVLSGGIPPNTYTSPVTFTGLALSGGNGSSGFPITLGATSIAASSTTSAVTGLEVNGVTLSAVGSSAQFLNESGSYAVPPGTGVASLNTLTGALTLAVGSGLSISQTGSTITVSLATAFSITSFTGGSTVELGYSVVNPSFAATYSVTPASANITNTESISSPTNLVTPFTSGTITGTFVHTSVETTTFTLAATQGTTQTATQTISWQPSIFGGAGTAGATSTVTASGTTAVLSNSNVLPRTQLGAETVGETFGPYSPSGQVIYLLLTGGSHTFTDAGTGFPMAFNAPLTVTFLNANSVTLTMYLYQSTNSLYGTYTPKVAS
jgi:hypothetical protein